MAKCEFCNQDMLTAAGCVYDLAVIAKKKYKRIRVGEPLDWRQSGRCGDCNAAPGELHHYGCDMEVCPVCGEQFAFCDCPATALVLT